MESRAKTIEQYFDRLWPLNRSLTGEGNRETLHILRELIDLEISEIPSGTKCFDWEVPPEWNVNDAYIKDENGKKIVDFKVNNLFLLGYSENFQGVVPFSKLAEHIYTLPDQPTLIPYLTSYYKKRWGFCMSENDFLKLDRNLSYEVCIDASFNHQGSMTIAEAKIHGCSEKEILFSTYICHPSMANNELSGPLVSAFLFKELSGLKNLNYTYRFIFIPETIGSIYYLSKHGEHLRKNLAGGYVLTCIGDSGSFTFLNSRKGNTLIDRATELVLNQSNEPFTILPFNPLGSDERQYCSPGFNLPMGSLMRTMYGKYPEYHTSGDNKDFISFEAMNNSIDLIMDIIEVIENNNYFLNTNPLCEPQLGKRGLYPTLGSQKKMAVNIDSMMWLLNLSDGDNDLIDISFRSGISVKEIIKSKERLLKTGLLKVC
jgi:aminopeptidase-like protein